MARKKIGVLLQEKGIVTVSPNPFNAAVSISYGNRTGGIQTMQARNSRNAAPTLAIYDIHGRMVHPVNGLTSGTYTWDATGFPAGVYLLRATWGNQTLVKRLFLQK